MDHRFLWDSSPPSYWPAGFPIKVAIPCPTTLLLIYCLVMPRSVGAWTQYNTIKSGTVQPNPAGFIDAGWRRETTVDPASNISSFFASVLSAVEVMQRSPSGSFSCGGCASRWGNPQIIWGLLSHLTSPCPVEDVLFIILARKQISHPSGREKTICLPKLISVLICLKKESITKQQKLLMLLAQMWRKKKAMTNHISAKSRKFSLEEKPIWLQIFSRSGFLLLL